MPIEPANEPTESELRFRVVASAPPIQAEEIESEEDAIEVILMWGTNVLHVAHIGADESFVVGEEGAVDFLVGADVLGRDRLVIVDHGRFGPAGATAAGAPSTEGTVEPGVAEETKLEAGDLVFLVRRVRRGKRIAAGASVDREPLFYVGGALGFAALLLLLMSFVPPSSSALSLQHLERESRLVAALMTPPSVELDEPELAEPTPEEAGGQGERAADDEGQVGERSSAVTGRRFGVEGPEDNRDAHLARERAQETRSAGVLGTLRAMSGSWDTPTSPFGRDTALGSDPMSALGSLMGTDIGDDFGFEGLGLHGTGRGANGTGRGTIGLDHLGTLGRGAGCRGQRCAQNYGHGTGTLRRRAARVPEGIHIGGGETEVHGTLAREVIRRVIRRHRNEVRFCYEQGLQSQPDLQGRVTTRFVISPTGTVTTSLVAASTVRHPPTEQCIARAIRRWTFPSPDSGGVVSVTYPFVLQTR